MSDRPISIDRFIKLVTEEELDKEDVKAWYRCVLKHSPSGTTKTVNVVDDKGKPTSVAVVRREGEGTNAYLVPITRDLSEDEVETIVQKFADAKPDLDFTVETNERKLSANDYAGITLDAAKHVALCTALEKQKHENWMRERTGAGWRYGTEFDKDEKTHPLILPWEQLPDRYKQPDMDWPQKLIHLLNDEGYAVIQKDELNQLRKLLRTH